MPKIAILSDIHANLPALNAVLADADAAGADEVVFCGDTVGYGANPSACIAKVRERGGISVLGNHDAYTLELLRDPRMLPVGVRETNPVWAGVAHAAATLSEEDAHWLASLPRTLEIHGQILGHAALHKPHEWPYLHSPREAAPTLKILRKLGANLGFFGHTHRQEWFPDPSAPARPEPLEDGRVQVAGEAVCAVVVGSVGQPRGSDDLRAGWLLWDTEQKTFEFRRSPYPALEAAIEILHANLPFHSAERLLDDTELEKLREMIR